MAFIETGESKMVAKKKVAKKTAKGKAPLKVLPKKMSALIKIALADLRKAENDAKMVIKMETWLDRREAVCTIESGNIEVSREEVCVACFAGTVMAFTLGALKKKDWRSLGPNNFNKNAKQLAALDSLRDGDVSGAAESLGLYSDDGYPDYEFNRFDRAIPEYDRDDPEPFHKAMTKLQKDLKDARL
jgi:hypothetical protein